jgi:hypothetical protein
MAKINRSFIKGVMNKSVDERLLPAGEYVDAQNVRVGSTEDSEIGSLENSKGNTKLTDISYSGQPLSSDALCIGVYEDGANETIYWFVNDVGFGTLSGINPTGKLDLILSYNTSTGITTYHVISVNDGDGINTSLNFNSEYLITGVELVDDLLFFTDNYNPPRFINVNRSYASPSLDGGVLNDFDGQPATLVKALQVVKQPPLAAPTISLDTIAGDDTFIENEFWCFAYRYKYQDGEYSATSQFTGAAFSPKPFNFSMTSYLNEGMVNRFNSIDIGFNTGDSLVTDIELLYKKNDDITIRVIESLNKDDLGYANNTTVSYAFSVSKIFTVLPQSEILRLYDNVPLLSQAETVMGNRLMYGNYVEGYDMVTDALRPAGSEVKFEYSTELVSTDSVEVSLPTPTLGTTNFAHPTNPSSAPISVPNGQVTLDFSGITLKKDAQLSFTFIIEHDQWFPVASTPSDIANFSFTWTYTLQSDYSSAYDLFNDVDFRERLGMAQRAATVAPNDWATRTTMQPVFNTGTSAWESCNGETASDKLLCDVPTTNFAGGTPYFKYNSYNDAPYSFSGSPATPRGMSALTIPTITPTDPDSVALEILYLQWVNDTSTPTSFFYEFIKFNTVSVVYRQSPDIKSLHSSRDYEVGMVYMDDFNRSSTVMVSQNNSVHVPCSASDKKNQIKVTIPTTQKAPYWATKYKFFIKPDKENYETIYSNIYFSDPTSGDTFFLLEGEQGAKVSDGTRLVVKTDASGPMDTCTFATVLEKKAQAADFIPAPSGLSEVPAGLYMRIRAVDFDTSYSEYPFVFPGTQQTTETTSGEFPIEIYTGFRDGATDISIPQGGFVKVRFKFTGPDDQKYIYDNTIASTESYASIIEWWNGEGVGGLIEADALVNSPVPVNYITATGTSTVDLTGSTSALQFQWIEDASASDEPKLLISGFESNGGAERNKSRIKATFEIFRSDTTIVFETEPADAQPDVFYESAEVFDIYSIGSVGGFHRGNDQDQTGSDPAIITTDFFNCFAFGNGVESYKIRDSIIGATLQLGNRVSTTSAQDYREIRRFADITYSGVYNDETNTNKLNEFNLGLANFKPLEDVYGEIQRMDGRETDVLVLQEDKISYVLAGKNLLSDAAAGGTITSVPEVLGTQIARLEEHGISFNPESYVKYGADKFFTDQKRGAVIQLRGSSYSNEQLTLISERGMRSFFRDLFLDAPNTQKLGGYDPYMNEYVLSSIDRTLPAPTECLECGLTKQYSIANTIEDFCVKLKKAIGTVTVSGEVTSLSAGATVTISYRYPAGSGAYSVGATVNAVGTYTFNFDRDDPADDSADIRVAVSGGSATFDINVPCPAQQTITVVQVCVSDNDDATQFIHNEYRWTSGTVVGALQSSAVELQSGTGIPNISQYNSVSGPQGIGGMPPDGSTVEIISNKITPGDNFQFDPTEIAWAAPARYNKFMYLRSSTLYSNTSADINTLMGLATTLNADTITPLLDTYSNTFTMPAAIGSSDYLYLIYDYRVANQLSLRSSSDPDDACCAGTTSNRVINGTSLAAATSVFTDETMLTADTNQYYSEDSTDVLRQQSSGVLGQAAVCRTCASTCAGSVSNIRGTYGYSTYTYPTGNDAASAGAIILYIESIPTPTNEALLGIRVTLDGVVYNQVTSSLRGDVAAAVGGTYQAGELSYFGQNAAICAGLPGTVVLPEFEGTANAQVLTDVGRNTTQTIAANQTYNAAAANNSCMMVIPKPALATGTPSGVVANKLQQGAVSFNQKGVQVGDVVSNTTAGTVAFVTEVESDTTVALSADIFPNTTDSFSVTAAQSRSTELKVEISSPCPSTGTFAALWELNLNCPAQLALAAPVDGSGNNSTSVGAACGGAPTLTQTLYHAPQSGGSGGTVAQYDMVFTDANGVNTPTAGDYVINTGGNGTLITVHSTGTVTAVSTCPP